MLFRAENPILGPLSQIVWNDGSVHNLAGDSGSQASFAPAITSATPANFRAVDAEPVLSATSVAITGSVAAVRGNTTVAVGSTIASGFLYGMQGKLTVKGTIATANFAAGLVGQLDFSTATVTPAGPISAIWGDMGATLSASAISGQANLNILQLTNTAPGSMINSAIFVEANATYLLDVSNSSYSPFWHVGAPGTLSGSLKINTSAGPRYIAVYTTQ